MTYKPLYKPNQLILGTGVDTVIVSGWTDKKIIEKNIDKSDYAAIGNLYSPARGLSFLLRNLLANPQIRFLAILNATVNDKNSGSCDSLINFLDNFKGFKEGVSDTGKHCWVTTNGNGVKGIIDFEIEESALNLLRKNIYWKECKSIDELKIFINDVKSIEPKLEPWGEPLTFPDPIINTKTLPGPLYGHRIEAKTIAETWVKIIHRVRTTGTIRPTGYDGKWQELIDLIAIVNDEPDDFYFPEPNYLPIDRDFLNSYIPQILEDAPYEKGVKYTYGQRLRSWFGRDQIEDVTNKLIGEIDAASAVMNLWDSGRGCVTDILEDGSTVFLSSKPIGRNRGDSDHQHGGSPCLNHIWARVVDSVLSLTATFRSNDMFSAWPSNAMGLRALQKHIRDEIAKRSDYDLKIGPLITISQSAHIYDDCWENADSLIKNQYHKIFNKRDYSDPVGNFIIEVFDGEIVVEHQSPSGESVAKYCRKSAKKLYQEIAECNPGLDVEHAFYLGTELQKAEFAIRFKLKYIQDRDLSKV